MELIEKIESHNNLNPKLWNEDHSLKEDVRDKLEEIVDEFILELEENKIPIKVLDVHLVGSNASFNYTENSDLDVHIIANFEEVTCDPEILNLLYNFFKSYFNDKYDILIHGISIELYIEDMNASAISNGIYSLYEDEWVKFPEKLDIPDIDISDEFEEWEDRYQLIISNDDSEAAEDLVDDLYRLRKNSIAAEGEYGKGNLVFKEFRNLGYLDKLKELRDQGISRELSLEALKEIVMLEGRDAPLYHGTQISKCVMNESKEDNNIEDIKNTNSRNIIKYAEDPYPVNCVAAKEDGTLFTQFSKDGKEYLLPIKGKIEYIDATKFYSYQPRIDMEIALKYSKVNPYKFPPVIAVRKDNNEYQVVEGNHRVAASIIGKRKVKTLVYELNELKDEYDKIKNSIIQQSGQITEAKENNNVENIKRYIKNNFNISTHTIGGPFYILSNGSYLNLGRAGSHLGLDDELYQNGIIEQDPFDYSYLYPNTIMVDLFNAIRCSDGENLGDDEYGNPYIQLPKNLPTNAQLESLDDWIYSLGYNNKLFVDEVEYNLSEVSSEYIIKKIKRYYSSGKLYESLFEEAINPTLIFDAIKREFGTSESPIDGPSFLLPDGTFIDMNKRTKYRDFAAHANAEEYLQDIGLSTSYIEKSGSPTLQDLGTIRLNTLNYNNFIELSDVRPTPAQYRALQIWLDENEQSHPKIDIITPNFENSVTYNYGDYIVDEIISKIKRYYSSGQLYESLNPEIFYRITVINPDGKEAGLFRGLNKLLKRLWDNDDEIYDEINYPLSELEDLTHYPENFNNKRAIFAYKEDKFNQIKDTLLELEYVLNAIHWEVKITKIRRPDKVVYEDDDQIAYDPKTANIVECEEGAKLQESKNHMDIEEMIEQAYYRHPKPEDIFEEPWDELVDPKQFYSDLTRGASPEYKARARKQILMNDEKNVFYNVLLGYLDSLGTGSTDYMKLEPAIAKKINGKIVPQDGGHRAVLCKMLGMKLPVKFVKTYQESVDRTVYNALYAFPKYVEKYGKGSALFELKYKYNLQDDELVWVINKLIDSGKIDMFTRDSYISQLGLEDYKEDIKKVIEEDYLDEEDEKGDWGYHYGDLGKADYRRQFGRRGTGGFGTGTYFIGTPISQRKDGGSYKNRPEHKVDFSKYKLFKPRSNAQAYKLHDSLLFFNNLGSDFKGIPATWEEILDENEKVSNEVFAEIRALDDPEDVSTPVNIRKEPLLKYIRKYIEYYPYKIEDVDYYSLKEIEKYIRNARIEESDKFYRAVNSLRSALDYSVSEERLLSVIDSALKTNSEIAPSTLIMQKLGYEGIDVRHLNKDADGLSGLDNFGYGSVIYDLKESLGNPLETIDPFGN